MRFEIGPGGALVLMLGLAGLSGGVFYLGLVAGTEMSRQEQIEPEHADLMPLPSPPAADATPARVAAPPNSLAPGTGSMASGPPAGSPPGARPSSAASPGLAASPSGGGNSPPEVASKTNGAGGEEEGDVNPP